MKGDDALTTYLHGATRGLRRRERQAVTSELLGHIEARVQDFKLGGLSDAEALRQTLRELGEPAHVQRGMQRVYVWPGLIRTAGLSSLLIAGLAVGAFQLSSVLAQVQGYKPTFTPLPGPYTYVDTQSLRDELQKAGVTVTGDLNRPSLTLPGQTTPIQVNTAQSDLPAFVNRAVVRDYLNGHSYLDLNAVVSAAIGAGQRVRVEGWLNPKLHLGNVTLALGTADQPLEAYNLYTVALNPLAQQVGATMARSSRTDDLSLYSHHRLSLPDGTGPDDVFALVSVQRLSSIWGRGTPPILSFDLTRPDWQGHLNFRMPYDLAALQLSGDPQTLKADLKWLQGHSSEYATPQRPAHALLLKLSGNLSGQTYQIVPRTERSVGEQY